MCCARASVPTSRCPEARKGIVLEVCVLGSGSSGNCLFVSSGSTRLLIDAGLSLREIRRRLALIGQTPEAITALLVTHEHVDHCRGVPTLARTCGAVRLLANESTARGVELIARTTMTASWDIFQTGAPFEVGDLRIEPFAVPHDAGDPVAYTLSDGRHRLGVVTDLGVVTPVVCRHLQACDALILETNHDVEMVQRSDRPWPLKQRILGRQGHLSNEQGAELLGTVAGSRLQAVFLAHLSAECNTPELAEHAVRQALRSLRRQDVAVHHTFRDRIAHRLTLA